MTRHSTDASVPVAAGLPLGPVPGSAVTVVNAPAGPSLPAVPGFELPIWYLVYLVVAMSALLLLLAAFGVAFTGFLSYRLARDLPIPCFVFTEDSCQRFAPAVTRAFSGSRTPFSACPVSWYCSS